MSSELENGEPIESTLGLRLDQLADLLSVATDDRALVEEAGAEEENVSQILRRRLSTLFPGDSGPTGLPGRSALQVLLDPESAVSELTGRQTPPELPQSYGFGFSVSKSTFGHGGAYSTNSFADTQRGLILIWLVQHAGFPGEGNKSQEAFKRAAFEAFAPPQK